VGAELFHVDGHNFGNAPKNAVPVSKKTHCISHQEHSFNAVYRNCMKPYQSIRSGLRTPNFWILKWLVHVDSAIPRGPRKHESLHKLKEYTLIFYFTT
jgi:hypothetical protein